MSWLISQTHEESHDYIIFRIYTMMIDILQWMRLSNEKGSLYIAKPN